MEKAKEEMDEFQTSSREYEAELEAQLTSVETKNKELNATASRQSMDIEILRVSLNLEKLQKYCIKNNA